MKRTAVLVIIAAVLVIVTLSGCSPSSNPTPTPSPFPTVTLPPGQEPVAIVSVTGPIKPINPGGPTVEITLKNLSVEPVISLEATLDISSAPARRFVFTFDVTPSHPLTPENSISARQTLIGGGFSDTTLYPVTINGTLENNTAFLYTKTVLITTPTE
jgi:hypothetical protein